MWMRKSVSLVAAAAVGSVIGLMIFSKKQPMRAEAQHQAKEPPAPPAGVAPETVPARAGQPIVPVAGAPTSFVELVKRARPSVVNIHSIALIRQRPVAVPF